MKPLIIVALLSLSAAAAQAQVCVENAKIAEADIPAALQADHTRKLEEAKAEYSVRPTADNLIWHARRLGYLGKYKEAIAELTAGIVRFPADARMYRHRGHRYLTLRCFDDAVKDLQHSAKLIRGKADEIEPDGLPNAKNIPTSTLQSNIWYHLGLAYYLKGDLKSALGAYAEASKVSRNNDMRVATAYWHYMTLRRAGRETEAARVLTPFGGGIEVIENDDYLNLIRLNRGEVKAENLLKQIEGDASTLSSASLGYGIGNYYLYNGDRGKAVEIFQKIVAGDQWASFGYIAAEADLARQPSQK